MPGTKIWIVNQYANTPQMGGSTRHFALAKYLLDHEIQATLVAGTVRLDAREGASAKTARRRVSTSKVDGVGYVWLRTKGYSGNGLGRLWSMLKFSVSVLRHARHVPRADRPDLIIGSSPHLFAALAASLVARRFRVPFILEVRDLWPQSLVDLLGVSSRHPMVLVLARIEQHLYRRADAIIGLLPGVESYVHGRVGDQPQVTWIPNGVDMDSLPNVTPASVGPDFTVVYTGAHGVPNALDTALGAAQRLSGRNTSQGGRFLFRFFGDGVAKEALVRQAKELGLDNVAFLDRVPKTEVFSVLSEGDACLVTARKTSLYEHGMSLNKLFDYFAAGRPILMGLETPFDPVRDAQAGVTFPAENPDALSDAIRQLDSLPAATRESMGHRGRAYVEAHHSMRVLARRLAGLVNATV